MFKNRFLPITSSGDSENCRSTTVQRRLHHPWELLSPIAIDVLIIPEELFLLSDFVKSEGSFTGTATELAEVLHLELRPAVLKKKMIKHMAYLNKNGIIR